MRPNRVLAGACGCDKDYVTLEDLGLAADANEDEIAAACARDNCPGDPEKREAGDCGCGKTEDKDLEGKCIDQCENDPDKLTPGVCGCGVPDIDTDGDGKLDCEAEEECPADPHKFLKGTCGCGFYELVNKKTGEVSCIERKPVYKAPKGNGKTIINPETGEPLVPTQMAVTFPESCKRRCRMTFEFGTYIVHKDGLTGTLSARKSSKKRSNKKLKKKVDYVLSLTEIGSRKSKTKKRVSKRNRLSIKNLKPGKNYLGSYKIQVKDKSGSVRGTSASSKTISFRTPG